MKKLTVVICTIIVLLTMAVAPASASVSGLGVGSPATSPSNPWFYDVETGKTYYEAGGVWWWTGLYGLRYSAHLNGDEFATIYGKIVESSNLADGYEQFPLKYADMTPIEIRADPETYWHPFYAVFSLPLKTKYYGKHYQISTEFGVQTGPNTWAYIGDTTYLITSEHPKQNKKFKP